jgi:hypothetical protein
VQCGTFATVFVRGILYPYVLVVPADNPLPPLAQVAEQQGKYLAHILNEEAAHMNPWQGGQGSPAASKQVGGGTEGLCRESSSGRMGYLLHSTRRQRPLKQTLAILAWPAPESLQHHCTAVSALLQLRAAWIKLHQNVLIMQQCSGSALRRVVG